MTYVPPYLENWNAIAHECPYRASITRNVSWQFHPSPDIIDAMKVSPGGRYLLAFRLKEVRDYFVSGYLDQSVKVEDDWCDRATKPGRQPAKAREPRDFDEARTAFMAARRNYDAADAVISDLFLKEIKALVAAKKTNDALRVIVSIHGDCVARTLGISTLIEAKHDFEKFPVGKAEALPLTPERAVALENWLSTRKASQHAENSMSHFVHLIMKEVMATKGRGPALEFANSLPSSVTKAFAIDRAKHGQAIEPTEFDEDEAPLGPRI